MTIDKINKTRFQHKWWNKNKKLNNISRDLKEFENGK